MSAFRDYLPGSAGVDWLARYRRFRREFLAALPSLSKTEREARLYELADLRGEFPNLIFGELKP